jgi:hypothetical protein
MRQLKRHKATGIPILDRDAFLAAPIGSEMQIGGNIWRKNDENELITRKEARRQTKAMFDAFSSDMVQFLERNRIQNEAADKAIWREDAEKRCVFSSLLFVSDPSWESGMETLRARYNSVAAKALDEIRKLRTLWTDDAEMIAAFLGLENKIIASSSNMNEALRKAIAEGDKGAALKELSETISMSISDELKELLGNMRTEGIATDRGWDRGSVWIGWQCNKMERTQQTVDIEKMWKTLHRRLLVNQRNLYGDERAALDWFNRHTKTPDGRQINKEVSRFKQQLKPYYEERTTLDRTQDTGSK